MEIILLFVVISVISSIIKSVGRSQTAQQGRVGNVTPMDIQVEKPEIKQRDQIVDQYNPIPKADDKRVHFKKENPPIIAPRIAKTSEPGLKIRNINRSKLVEGIILSEILGSPKSRRPSFKN